MMIFGVGAVALIAGYFLFFRKKSENGGSTVTGDVAPKLSGGTIEVGPAKGKGEGKWVGIPSGSRKEVEANLKVGDYVRVGGQDCTISEFWRDAEGRAGALRCEEIPKGQYNIAEGTNLQY